MPNFILEALSFGMMRRIPVPQDLIGNDSEIYEFTDAVKFSKVSEIVGGDFKLFDAFNLIHVATSKDRFVNTIELKRYAPKDLYDLINKHLHEFALSETGYKHSFHYFGHKF